MQQRYILLDVINARSVQIECESEHSILDLVAIKQDLPLPKHHSSTYLQNCVK